MDTGISFSPALNEKQHHILSLSSLFESDFSIDTLIELSGFLASEVLSALEHGIGRSWLAKKESGVFLFQETKQKKRFCADLSKENRQNYHRKIANHYLRGPAGNSVKKKAAYHLLKIKNNVDECRILSNAGDAYSRIFDDRNALKCYEKVIRDLENEREEEAGRLFVNNVLKYSRTFSGDDDPEWIIPMLKKALAKTEANNLGQYKSLLNLQIAKNQWFQGFYKKAVKTFQKGLEIAEETDDPKVLRSANIFKLFFSNWQGLYGQVIEIYEKLAPEVDQYPKSRSSLLASVTAGLSYVRCGRVSHGLGMLDALFKSSEKRNDLFGFGFIGNTIGAVLVEIGRFDEAIQYLLKTDEKAIELQTAFNRLHRQIFIALAYMLKNGISNAKVYLKKIATLDPDLKMPLFPRHHMIMLSWLLGKKHTEAHPALNQSVLINNCLQSENIHDQGTGYRYLALMEKSSGKPPEEILPLLEKSIRRYEKSGNVILLAQTRLDLSAQYYLCGRVDKAKHYGDLAAQDLLRINPALIPKDHPVLSNNIPYQDSVLDKILELGQEFVTIRDYRELLSRVISTSNQITGAERGAIFFIDKEKKPFELVLKASKNISKEELSQPGFQRSAELIRKTAAEGTGTVMDFSTTESDDSDSESIISCFCLPMILKNEIMGVLYHDNCMLKANVQGIDLNVLSLFSTTAAIALDNAQAYEKIQRHNESLQEEKDYFKDLHIKDFQHEGVVGNSKAIKKNFNQVEKVAPEDTTVLILGETGVGKEVFARLIHQRSNRKGKTFIRVDCSALSESLIASELFGHERGAFTGATQKHIGRFELANGGTLFLDEIGNISPDIQVRLLRVLQTKEFQRVGGRETIKSDFRLVTATNKDLRKEVDAGRFREDLYYRLNIFPITPPPLRERKDDIPLLASFFLEKHARKVGKPALKVSKKSMESLMRYNWPGNVRELENVIERSIILSSNAWLNLVQLDSNDVKPTHHNLRITLKENERRHILWALEETGGKIRGPGGAAELLDVHHNTLRSRMKKLGIKAQKRAYAAELKHVS